MKGALSRLAIATVLLTLLVMHNRGGSAFAATPSTGNTTITNGAVGTYQDTTGVQYEVDSNLVQVTVQGVSALAVSPKEAAANPAVDGYAAGQPVTRTFTIVNTSNIPDAYRITSFTADRGSVTSLAFVSGGSSTPIAVGTTISATIQPGQSVTVQAVINTSGVAVGTPFALRLTAQTTVTGTANGLQSDSGIQWLISASAPSLSGPSGANTPVSKTVNATQVVQSQGGAIVHFDVVTKNYGGIPATNVVMTDVLPPGLTSDITTLKLNGLTVSGATLSGQTLSVPLGTLNAGATDDVSFDSLVENVATLGAAFVNVASLSADGISPLSTTPAVVFIGTADVVYDPAANNMPVQGATVSLLDDSNNLVPLTSSNASQFRGTCTPLTSTPAAVNTQNPYTTTAGGTYGFALQPSQVAPGGSIFHITVSTPGYLNRRIKAVVTPSSTLGLYDVTASAEDGQPIAQAGAYSLTTGSSSLDNIFGLFGNLPLFKKQTIAIDKIADRSTAQPGDRVTYTVTISNPSSGALTAAQIVDTLPAGEFYANGTATIDGTPQEPVVNGRTMTWTTGVLSAGASHVLRYVTIVYPNVPGDTILTNTAMGRATINGTQVSVNASANAEVQIVQGALSDRIVITGRVFSDVMRTGRFTRGDSGMPGVRIFMEDGTSVVTDAQGRFSFPAANPGMHVLRVDPTTLPDRARGELQRLVHGILDDGLMEDVEFAVTVP